MPYAHFYIRCSTEDQARYGHTIEAQQSRAREYYDRVIKPKHPEVEMGQFFIEEGVSAFRIPLLQREQGYLFDQSLQRGDHGVFTVFDRAFRNPKDFHCTVDYWQSKGVILHFMDIQVDGSTAAGELMLGMRALMARWDSRIISERTKAVASYLKSRGKPAGGRVPQGFKLQRLPNGRKRRVPDPRMRAIMQEVVRLKDVENRTFAEIAKIIKQRLTGYTTSSKSPWYKADYWTMYVAQETYYREKKLQAEEAAKREARSRLLRTAGKGGTPCHHNQDNAQPQPLADSDGSADHPAAE